MTQGMALPADSHPGLDALRQEALAAARGLSSGESALVGVLRDLEQERSRAAQAYRAVVASLAAALEARDGYTGEHSDDVHALSVAVARRLRLGDEQIAEVESVALLHDIGKIGIPDHVLHKPGPLDDEEWLLMREHPVIGERILRPLPGLSAVATAVRHEHERWDGGGYPDGLAGEAIPLASRIVLACDAYTALVSDRPYRKALSTATATEELRRCAGSQFDPRVVEALLACLDDPATLAAAPDGERALAVLPETGGADEPRLQRELHALIGIATAVAAAHRLEDVIEVVADQALEAVEAASLSISRWEVQGRLLRTLINAGALAPGEERLPADETYRLDGDDAALRETLVAGTGFRWSLGDPGIHPMQRDLLERIGKEHCVGVPISFAGRPWGELWATRGAGQDPFADRDLRFLQSIADQVAAAVGRAELFSRMAELAFEDPLTGVANRRALDERLDLSLAEALDAGRDLAVMLCDVDNLKELNDEHGHAAGDASLVRVASLLREVVAPFGNALVARVGGDEFCVLLEDADAEAARRLGERLLARLVAGEGPRLSVSCGVASVGLGARRAGDLLRAADAAQYTAKRAGRARVYVADDHVEQTWTRSRTERRAIRGRDKGAGAAVRGGAVLADVLALLDRLVDRPPLDRAEHVAMAIGEAVDASATCVSWIAPGSAVLETVFLHDRRFDRTSGHRFGTDGTVYDIGEYPQTREVMEHGGSFTVVADDPDADAAERALLAEWGMTGVLAAGVADPHLGGWLVELYADGATAELEAVEPALRLLVAEAVRAARPVQLRSVG
jgi:diguanylate cyclase (GGDEF)-like protein